MNVFYDKKMLRQCLVIFAGLLLVMNLSKGVGFVAIFPLILLTLTRNRPEMFLFYILLTISMVVTNPAITPRGMGFFIEQRAILGFLGVILTIKIAGQRVSPIVRPFVGMLFYVLFMTVPSITGWMPLVSLLKLFLFAIIYFSLYGTANLASQSNRTGVVAVRTVILAVVIPFIVGSLLVIPFPSIGMMSYEEYILSSVSGGSLFRGFTNHAQCLGPVVACIFTILLADFLFGIKRPDKLYIFLLLCCPVLIWKTSSRTALGALLSSVAFVSFFFMRERRVAQRWKSRVFHVLLVLLILGSVALIFSGAGESVKRFLAKRDAVEGEAVTISVEQITSSRMGLTESQIDNFKKKPLCGNGFQVSEELAYMDVSNWKSLLSAPVEKGVWITAILEEGGVLGFSLFLLFVMTVFATLLRYKAYVGASTFFVFLVLNLGEFTLFSMSYSGGFCWAMVFAGLVLDSMRTKKEMMDSQAYVWRGSY